jgi:hypothetical protein
MFFFPKKQRFIFSGFLGVLMEVFHGKFWFHGRCMI